MGWPGTQCQQTSPSPTRWTPRKLARPGPGLLGRRAPCISVLCTALTLPQCGSLTEGGRGGLHATLHLGCAMSSVRTAFLLEKQLLIQGWAGDRTHLTASTHFHMRAPCPATPNAPLGHEPEPSPAWGPAPRGGVVGPSQTGDALWPVLCPCSHIQWPGENHRQAREKQHSAALRAPCSA